MEKKLKAQPLHMNSRFKSREKNELLDDDLKSTLARICMRMYGQLFVISFVNIVYDRKRMSSY